MWGRGLWEISIPSARLCYEHKTALKIKSIKNLKNKVYISNINSKRSHIGKYLSYNNVEYEWEWHELGY